MPLELLRGFEGIGQLDATQGLLILIEGERVLALAEVVVERHRSRQYDVGADGPRRALAKASQHDAVVVGPRGTNDQLLERRVIEVAELQQAPIAGVTKGNLAQRQEQEAEQRGQQTLPISFNDPLDRHSTPRRSVRQTARNKRPRRRCRGPPKETPGRSLRW